MSTKITSAKTIRDTKKSFLFHVVVKTEAGKWLTYVKPMPFKQAGVKIQQCYKDGIDESMFYCEQKPEPKPEPKQKPKPKQEPEPKFVTLSAAEVAAFKNVIEDPSMDESALWDDLHAMQSMTVY